MLKTEIETEEWRPVLGFEGMYQVSNLGRVRSLERIINYSDGRIRTFPGRIIRPGGGKNHLYVFLHRRQVKKKEYVHRLVLESFVGPCPPGMEACHDPDYHPHNNRLSNLRWATASANQRDAIKQGRRVVGEKHPESKYSSSAIRRVHELRSKGLLHREIAAETGIPTLYVGGILRGEKRRHDVKN